MIMIVLSSLIAQCHEAFVSRYFLGITTVDGQLF